MTPLRSPVRTEYGGAFVSTVHASVVFECIECKVEVVQFTAHIRLFLTFLDLLSPHGTIDMDKLVDLERNESA